MALYAKFDCAFPDDPKVIDAGDIAELVYFRCVLRSREALTDGVIDRRLIGRWCAGIRGRATAHAAKLVEVGLWEPHPNGWMIPRDVWARWNPTKAEVEAKREEEAQRKKSYRDSKKRPDGVPLGHPDASAPRDRQPEPEPEPHQARGTPNGTPRRADPRCAEAITEHMAHLVDTGTRVGNANGLRRTIERDQGADLRAWFEAHPDATPIDGARAILGTGKPKAPIVDAVTGVRMSPYAQ